jgi:hypothetical protein|tara:strand:+ start:6296 stop:6586 length:291 start_codon:yes stop_codon:yes gene_type:complete
VADLRIDLDGLESADVQLGRVERAFEHSDSIAAGVADLVGHSGLAGKLSEFSNAWDLHRDDMLTGVRAVRKTVRKVHDEFAAVDRELASNLNGDGS